jgi:nicotinamidase-related amidase
MLKTKFEEIVDVLAIGKKENTRDLSKLLINAGLEDILPAENDKERVLMVNIDIQQDFMENGALGVPGSHKDVERLTKFMYDNLQKITKVVSSIDTHIPQQIFFPCWWINAKGEHPNPYTVITWEDVDNDVWMPMYPTKSKNYVYNLKQLGKKELMIWNYHCIKGTSGCSLENQYANMVYFHSITRRVTAEGLVKGQDPFSEMYGIFQPEYDEKNTINIAYLDLFQKYDKVIIAGQAKSHCVLSSIEQIAKYYENRPDMTSKIYILEDCMSIIPGFEQSTEDVFKEFKNKYKMHIVKSTDLTI